MCIIDFIFFLNSFTYRLSNNNNNNNNNTILYKTEKGENTWTTRFAVVAQDGETPAPEPEKTQPNGGKFIIIIIITE